ncbi:hypothetical protein EPUL_001497 [Erysiphe pulchra]|uniref:Uncharacterized protein n=1 Tax=Erysiphe pulchra TaxID=225359 RepID=A0A2S4PWE8_9PEZI|nr:hypothetical protein EPUL_001497 [Erysiphe pulchra]
MNRSKTLNNTASRKILKLAVPIKRRIPERSTHNNKNNSDVANAFLPKELAEVVATRQHRERVWHVRLMKCTTIHSGINSTWSNFSKEIEKEKAEVFKAYTRLAIAKFAAVDSSSSSPQIPTHTRPTKGDRIGKDKSTGNKVAVALPKNQWALPKIPQLTENTWASVARAGQKKTRIILSNRIQVNPTGRQSHRPANKDKSKSKNSASQTAALSDKRLFIHLPQEHKWRKLPFAGIREFRSSRGDFLKAGNSLFLSGAKSETATNWVSVLVPTVPASAHMEQGLEEVTKAILSHEIERVCSVRPAHLKLYGGNKPEAHHRTWLAYFSKVPRGVFRVFDESGIVRPYKKQQPLEFCNRCNGYHQSKNCSRAPSCANCGSINHTADICMAVTKCKNCGGPHRANSRRCLARPTRSGTPSKE